MREFLFGLFFLTVGSAAAQTTAPTPLVLPTTDRLVVDTCFVLWSSQIRPQNPIRGKDFWPMLKKNLPSGVPEDVDKILGGFGKGMADSGFKVDIPETCGKLADDPDGGITARFMFSVFPPGSGSPGHILQTDTFLKVPGEGRVMGVRAKNLGAKEEVAASITAAMTKAIVEAQSKK